MLNKADTTHSQRDIPLWTRIIKLRACLIVSVTFAFYAVRMFRLISRYSVNIFFSDQWDFKDATLFDERSLWQMFDAQHGPHRLGVGALFERMVDPLFGWNSRTESFIVGGVIVVAAICGLWLKKRLYGHLSIFDVVIPAILFVPGQWATWFNVANFAHGPFPLLLILLYGVSWTFRRRVVRYPLILFINFLSIYTGFGIFLGVLTPILLLVDYSANTPENRLPTVYFISALLLSVASLACFFVGYKFWPASQCFSFQLQSPVSYLAFVALMFANFFGLKDVALPVQVIGIMIVAAVLVSMTVSIWLLFRQKTTSFPEAVRDRNLIVACLTAYTLLFCTFTAYGRMCQGLRQP